jgi:putative phosphoesterase
VKIGVISDTHIPALSPVLPVRITALFKGLDIILHAGDICEMDLLEQFQETYTLTFAVWGESDGETVRHYVDEKQVVRFGERRVGMIHGHQFMLEQKGPIARLRARLRALLGARLEPNALPNFLLQQFAGDDVHAIVFGHTHRPYVRMHNGVLLFNPGAALPGPGRTPSAGILNVGERSITGKILYL